MGIPRKLHFIWFQGFDEIPDKYIENIKSYKRYNDESEWEYCLWYEDKMDDIVSRYYPEYHGFWKRYRMIQKIDSFKYFILNLMGGFYCDIDTVCEKSFADLLEEQLIFSQMNLSAMQSAFYFVFLPTCRTYVNNHFIGSMEGHPFWKYVFVKLEPAAGDKSRLYGTGYNTMITTGPLFISIIFDKEYRGTDYKIYPCEYFDPINNSTGKQSVTENTHIKHTTDNTWISKKDKSFTDYMNAGENYQYIFLIIAVVFALFLAYWLIRGKYIYQGRPIQ